MQIQGKGHRFLPGWCRTPVCFLVCIGALAGLRETIRARHRFQELPDFVHRVGPDSEELEALVRGGDFDEFGRTRLEQFWEVQQLVRGRTEGIASGQT